MTVDDEDVNLDETIPVGELAGGDLATLDEDEVIEVDNEDQIQDKAKKSKDKSSAPTIDQLTFLDTPGHAAFSSMRRASSLYVYVVALTL